MIESFGPRPTAPSGPAASLPAMQAGEKVVHRPEKKVLPTENVDRTAQTGPRPAFQHTYLEQLAAFWPEEPEPPATEIDYAGDEENQSSPEPRAADGEAPPESRAAEESVAAIRPDDAAPLPALDIRR